MSSCSPGIAGELVEPESSTGPKKSRFNRNEPPLAEGREVGAAVNRHRQREREDTRDRSRVSHQLPEKR